MEFNSCKTLLLQEEASVSKEGVGVVDDDVEDDDGPLPGFRFHPTDEELVSFYLKRKVEKRRALSIEIITEIDIYKQDPWDLAKANSSLGDNKEWYYYCKRGRKYRNSIRPNRVTGSGFWKATGIDKPIYSNGGEGHQCIGLKKSLVYYRGSAGKGTKTDWMMHEFRLPSDTHLHDQNFSNPNDTTQEAEIWTLCRIFKRSKRPIPDWRQLSSRKNVVNSSLKTSSIDSNTNQEHYISFLNTHQATVPNHGYNNSNLPNFTKDESKDIYMENHNGIKSDQKNVDLQEDYLQQQWNSMAAHTPQYTSSSQSMLMNHVRMHDDNDEHNLVCYGWDDLNSIVQFAFQKPFCK